MQVESFEVRKVERDVGFTICLLQLSTFAHFITLLNFTAVRGLRFAACLVLLIVLTSMSVAAVTYVDVTDESGIHFRHSSGTRSSLLPEDMGSGAGFADIDNDGDIDLYVVNLPGPFKQDRNPVKSGTANVLYRNNGNGTFTDITKTAGVGHRGYGMGCVFADYDGDGSIDLYVTNYGANVLYRNNGDGTFHDVTGTAGVGCELWSTGAAFADVDGDNDLDLYVCNYVTYDLEKLEQMKEESLQSGKPVPSALNPHVFEPQDNVFYRNNGDGTFTDVTAETGIAAPGAEVCKPSSAILMRTTILICTSQMIPLSTIPIVMTGVVFLPI